MTTQMKFARRAFAATLLLAMAFVSPLQAAPARIYAPDSAPYGKTIGEWAAQWWQWALSFPEAQNPVADTTGQFCNVGQKGAVWFLAGTFGNDAERTCTVPADKGIFLPVHNWIFGAGAFDCEPTVPGVTCDVPTLREKAAAATESATLLSVIIDGVPVSDVQQYRASSPQPFSVTFPEGAVFGIPAGTHYPHVADGYWMMLRPLRPGQHTIEIQVQSSLGFGYHLDYVLTVTDDVQ